MNLGLEVYGQLIPAPFGAAWGETGSPLGGLCLLPFSLQGHGADALRALAGAAVVESITPVGMGPGRDFVVTEKSCFLQGEDGNKAASALKDALPTHALPRPHCSSIQHSSAPQV